MTQPAAPRLSTQGRTEWHVLGTATERTTDGETAVAVAARAVAGGHYLTFALNAEWVRNLAEQGELDPEGDLHVTVAASEAEVRQLRDLLDAALGETRHTAPF